MNGYEYAASTTFAAACERGVGVAVRCARSIAGGCFESSSARFAKPSLLCDAVGAFVPLHLQLLARGLRLPPAVGDDRDAGQQPGQIGAALDDERVPHAGQRLDRVEVGAGDLAAEHRALLEHRLQHARHREVDAEERLAGHDRRVVDAAASACR